MTNQISYREAGVDTQKAAVIVTQIGKHVARTQKHRNLVGAFGLFAVAYDLSDYQKPVIVTGCDGVGTKLELLLKFDLLETAGKDLVAMSVNDILTTGGDPLLFLDYIGLAKLDESGIDRLIEGMADYLEACHCILAGGETAEMPGIVPEGIFELSGFCIGCTEKEKMLDPRQIKLGDVLVGFPSDGLHANGWSLVRRILEKQPNAISEEELKSMLAPTKLYYDVVKKMASKGIVPKAMAHITGGGLPENLERLLDGVGARVQVPKWKAVGIDKLFKYVDEQEAFRTFNMGIGWVAIVSAQEVEPLLKVGLGACIIGEICEGQGVDCSVEV